MAEQLFNDLKRTIFKIESFLEEALASSWLIIIFIILFLFFLISFISYFSRENRAFSKEKKKATGSIDDFSTRTEKIFKRLRTLLFIFVSLLLIIVVIIFFKINISAYINWIILFLIPFLIYLIISLQQEVIKNGVDSTIKAMRSFVRMIGIIIILFFALIGIAHFLGMKELLEPIDRLSELILKKISKLIE